MSASVYIVLLNWNSWRDTLECLESVCRLSYGNFRVTVCDNGSTDDSVKRILDWATGSGRAEAETDQMAGYSSPPFPKPVTVRLLNRVNLCDRQQGADPLLTVIQNGANLGFAAGCNVGIQYALACGCSYVWLLNNDTVVSRDALTALVATAESDPTIGITGSTIWRYHQPDSVQAHGGTAYNRWMARTPRARKKNSNRFGELDCILGCSMLVSRLFLEEIGLMDESYFLYFEELDWAERCRGRFQLKYAEDSNIYHKEGASIGSSGNRSSRSLLSEFYLSRNRILFTKKFYPWLLPSVIFWVVASALFRLAKGDLRCCMTILKGALEGGRC